MEKKITNLMTDLDIEETEELIKDFQVSSNSIKTNDIEEIKKNVLSKIHRESFNNDKERGTISIKDKSSNRKIKHVRNKYKWKYVASITVFCLLVFTWMNSESLVQAFHKFFNLIPGVGIVENNQEILYILKSPETTETENGKLSLLSAVATNDAITVSFSYDRKDISEEQLLLEKQEEWERLVSGNSITKPRIYLILDEKKYEMTWGSSGGGGLSEFVTANIELDDVLINPSKNYTLNYADYHTSVDFQLVKVDQYNSLEEIGATNSHNNISVTAVATKTNQDLKVNVYPLNLSNYRLLSFDYEYDSEYFGKKLTLKTENGDKDYSLPNSYGSGMNAAYTFDISDGSKELHLHIPFIVVESNETSKVTLPIPKEGEVIELNKEVKFKKGSVVITSVELEGSGELGFGYGYLKINLSYNSFDENQQFVGINVTRGISGDGWAEEYDEDNRLIAIHYALEKSDTKQLKLDVVKPKFVLMDEYHLHLNVSN